MVLGSKRTEKKPVIPNDDKNIVYVYQSDIAKNVAPARQFHSAAPGSVTNQRLWIYGGIGVDGKWLQSTLDLFDYNTLKWYPVVPIRSLPCRCFHSSVSYNGSLYVFGGQDSEGKLSNGLFTVSEEGLFELIQPSGDIPDARKGHSVVDN